MDNAHHEIVGIGAALLDVVLRVPAETLKKLSLEKGRMHLVDSEQSSSILNQIQRNQAQVFSGGSIANTTINLSLLGNNSAFIGSVGNEKSGKQFTDDLQSNDVTPYIHTTQEPTGKAVTLITPDGERTFATNLGTAHNLELNEEAKNAIRNSEVFYIEGYLLDNKKAEDTVLNAAKLARENDTKVAVAISDVSIVERHQDKLRELIDKYANIVFANADEACSYTGENVKNSVDKISKECDVAVVTLGEEGSVIKSRNETYKIPGTKAPNIINTNGAGDTYAAGVLHGILSGMSLSRAGEIGSRLAASVVSHNDARLPKEYFKNNNQKLFKKK